MEYFNTNLFTIDAEEIRAERLNGLIALLLSVTCNTNRDVEKHPQPFMPNDFMPWIAKKQSTTPEGYAEDPKEVDKRTLSAKNVFKATLATATQATT
jgi:hypothetical protein